ncbi:MAG TPA: 6-bladed beta-propeller [Longimicrobium sp.]|nr:6-bladed beta-propeller [Longimicrobium sp.]
MYVLDHMNFRVTAFSPDGRVLWKVGRAGRGPGEFQLPYRLDVAPNGNIVVFDFGASEVTTLSPSGTFVGRVRLPFSFRQVDNLVALANGDLLISGFTTANDRVTQFGIHRFRVRGEQLEHIASFGPLPNARDREVLAHWGAGNVVRTSAGDLLYLLRLPYEVHRYDSGGRERAVYRPRTPLRAVPDDFVRIERTARGTAVSSAQPRLERLGSVLEVANRWVVASRIGPAGTTWDLFDVSGRLVASRAIPREWGALLGYDRARNVLWLAGTQDDAPVLLRLVVVPVVDGRRSRGGPSR